jgi:fluoride ion exporter CrcB/FEX
VDGNIVLLNLSGAFLDGVVMGIYCWALKVGPVYTGEQQKFLALLTRICPLFRIAFFAVWTSYTGLIIQAAMIARTDTLFSAVLFLSFCVVAACIIGQIGRVSGKFLGPVFEVFLGPRSVKGYSKWPMVQPAEGTYDTVTVALLLSLLAACVYPTLQCLPTGDCGRGWLIPVNATRDPVMFPHHASPFADAQELLVGIVFAMAAVFLGTYAPGETADNGIHWAAWNSNMAACGVLGLGLWAQTKYPYVPLLLHKLGSFHGALSAFGGMVGDTLDLADQGRLHAAALNALANITGGTIWIVLLN